MTTTNFVQATYNEIYDLNTQANEFSVLKFHSPTGRLPRMYLGGFFRQYKKYRYYGCKITLVPAATLPADPLQVSYEAGEPTIDPRDMLNPILHKPYHGEALKTDWMRSADYSAVDEQSEVNQAGAYAIYYASLQDNSWKKAHIQRGFTASGTPLIRPMATNYQLPVGFNPYGTTGVSQSTDLDWNPQMRTLNGVNDETGVRGFTDNGSVPNDTSGSGSILPISDVNTGQVPAQGLYGPSDPRVSKPTSTEVYANSPRDFEFFSSGYKKLGWLDTSVRMTIPTSVTPTQALMREYYSNRDIFNVLPKVYMHVALMPPAYKTEFYFRCVLTHYFGFAGFRGAMMPLDGSSEDNIALGQQNFNYPTTAPAMAMYEAEKSEPDVVPSVEIDSGDIQLNSVGVS